MNKKDAQKLVYLALGAVVVEVVLKNMNGSSAGSGASSDESLLSTITQGITNAVGTLTGTKQQNFITTMTPIAAQIQAQYGIDPLIVMTQAALESGWGTSGLTVKANNLYGYTGDAALNAWIVSKGLPASTPMPQIMALDLSAAPFIIMQTHEESPASSVQYFTHPGDVLSQTPNGSGGLDLEVYRPFRKYDSWLSSVEDWVTLMRTSRYSAAWADAQAGDLDSFAADVASAGYATESDYSTQLVSVGSEISDVQNA